MTSPIDELVAGLNPVPDDEITSEPSGEGGRALLASVTAEEAAAAAPPRRRLPGRARVTIGGTVAACAAAAAVAVLSGQDSGPLRSYANAAVRIDMRGDGYEVEVKDAYAGQEEFREAFAKMGLNVRLRIVPVSAARERKVIRVGSLPSAGGGGVPAEGEGGRFTTVLDCPPGRDACPLRVRVSGAMFRRAGGEIVIGRKARPGEVYADATPQRGDRPASLRLTGRTVGGALAELRRRGLTAVFSLGEFKADGSGYMWDPPAGWRPGTGRRVTGAWARSSNSVGLLVTPVKSDPEPDPTG
jgi:hypothetical protein